MPLDQSNRFYPSYQGAEDGVAGIVQLTTQGRRILLDPSSRICHGSDKQKIWESRMLTKPQFKNFLDHLFWHHPLPEVDILSKKQRRLEAPPFWRVESLGV